VARPLTDDNRHVLRRAGRTAPDAPPAVTRAHEEMRAATSPELSAALLARLARSEPSMPRLPEPSSSTYISAMEAIALSPRRLMTFHTSARVLARRNVRAQALPNGQCHLPVQTGPCPHANACLTCGHFRAIWWISIPTERGS
jgi:hypothetical protein